MNPSLSEDNQLFNKALESLDFDNNVHLYYDGEDADTCPICLQHWSTSGDHRLIALKCGHLFGHTCILKWLGQHCLHKCPTCKETINLQDIRFIFARKIVAFANSLDLSKVFNDLEIEKKKNFHMSVLLKEARTAEEKLIKNLEVSERMLQNMEIPYILKSDVSKLRKIKSAHMGIDMKYNTFDIGKKLMIIATKSEKEHNVYGIRKYHLDTDTVSPFTAFHTSEIRDVKIHKTSPWYLTCSIDGNVSIIDNDVNMKLFSFDTEAPLWSCCWDFDCEHTYYVGQQMGTVLKLDVRYQNRAVCKYFEPYDYTPIISIQVIKKSLMFPLGAVVVCKMNSIWVFWNEETGAPGYRLPINGPFISMSYDNTTYNMLISTKPNMEYLYSRHIYCYLRKLSTGIYFEIKHTFRGPRYQSEWIPSTIVDNRFVAIYDAPDKTVTLWNLSSGDKVISIKTKSTVKRLSYVEKSNEDYLACLCDDKVNFYKMDGKDV